MVADIVIEGGFVIDGTGTPGVVTDVAVVGGRIAAVGDLVHASATQRIGARGMIVAPGFVDAHVHSETELLRSPVNLANLHQGVTTHVVGMDGFGFAPTDAVTFDYMRAYLAAIYGACEHHAPGSVAEFLALYDQATTVNVATLIPNGCARLMVMGNRPDGASSAELAEMAEICRAGMREGALGLSSGLDYVPSGFASTDELVELSAAVAEFGGVYVSHIRYRDGFQAALSEAIEIGRRSGARPHISHLRPDSNGAVRPDVLLGIVDAARRDGLDVSYDTYPYAYGCTTLLSLLPLWMAEGTERDITHRLAAHDQRARIRAERADDITSWNNLELGGTLDGGDSRYVGKPLVDSASAAGADPVDFVCDLLIAHDLDVLMLAVDPGEAAVERDVEPMLAHEAHVMGSDAVYVKGRGHPRGDGAFARFVGSMVRDRGLMALEEAVRHAAFAPARRHGLTGRGLLSPGMAADVIVFDADAFADRGTLIAPALAAGMRDVIVNGVPAMLDGIPTGATPGRGLRRGD